MKSVLFEYPKQSAFGRVLPKNKIYEHGTPSSSVKELFVRQVDQIVWQYKLAPETINLSATKSVPEIQIFKVTLKNGDLKSEVLRCIDLAIPFPLVYEVHFEDQVQMVAAYKRPADNDSAKWQISEHFESEWFTTDSPRNPLPLALDLGMLYEKLLAPLLPYPSLDGEPLPTHIDRIALIRAKEKEVERCESRLNKEKQFNRKVEINAELRMLKTQLENLLGTSMPNHR